MDSRIDANQGIAALRDLGGPQAAEARGAWRGETVVRPAGAQSLIADAAEEITFAHSEKAEARTLAERRVRSGARGRVEAAEKLRAMMDKVKDFGGPEKLHRLKEQFRERRGATPDQVMERVRQQYRDVSHQYIALEWLLDALSGEGDAGLRESVREALETHRRRHGPAIRAGLNMTERAAAFAEKGLGDVGQLREDYRETVLGHAALADTYGAILKRYGTERFPERIEFLIRSAGDDLASRESSIEPAELKLILDDIYQLEVLGTVHERCDEVLDRTRRRFGIARGKAALDMMQGLLPLTGAGWSSGDRVARVAGGLGADGNVEAEIYLLHGLKDVIHAIPLKIYKDVSHRDNLLAAAQEALDAAIEREEQETA